ncbi:hypothetical protein HanIR_Chr02g0067081 [Helianthus annuus]|nr:hypothetical protein HanIR_Chr02g0067081 [Helianthus annuus]
MLVALTNLSIWLVKVSPPTLPKIGVDMGFGFAESLVWVRWSCKNFALRISSQELHQALRFRKEVVALCCLTLLQKESFAMNCDKGYFGKWGLNFLLVRPVVWD